MKKVVIIGSGFSSLSSAAYLAQAGYQVQVLEKNSQLGGRARAFEAEGFTFDMGPSWYWMPEVFERFYSDFGKSASDFYDLIRLDPSYKVVFDDGEENLPASYKELIALFESTEPGAGKHLDKFLEQAGKNYKIAMGDMVFRPGISPLELVTPQTVKRVNTFFQNVQTEVRKRFKHPRLRKILEFPVLFLGAKPVDTPMFYNMMNYADMVLGTWYPMGGMHQIVKAMVQIGEELGVEYITNANVTDIMVVGGNAKGVRTATNYYDADVVLSGADYAFTETLLAEEYRTYSMTYWNSRTFAPSALIYYLGVSEEIPNVKHHNLFFDEDFELHAEEIYDRPEWPTKPLFYACVPSKTDPSVAPKGSENVFLLMPLAAGLKDDADMRAKYFDLMLDRLEKQSGTKIREHIIYKKSYAMHDFKHDYNSFKGNAYGMANTLSQTAFLRPKIRSKKVDNLFFTGQLTVPGPGVPPAIISGRIAFDQIYKLYKTTENALT